MYKTSFLNWRVHEPGDFFSIYDTRVKSGDICSFIHSLTKHRSGKDRKIDYMDSILKGFLIEGKGKNLLGRGEPVQNHLHKK